VAVLQQATFTFWIKLSWKLV